MGKINNSTNKDSTFNRLNFLSQSYLKDNATTNTQSVSTCLSLALSHLLILTIYYCFSCLFATLVCTSR